MKHNHLIRSAIALLLVAAITLSLVLVGAAAPLTEGQTVRGDVNGDDAVNMKDVLLLRKYVAGMNVEFAALAGAPEGAVVRGDVNGDDTINMKDVLLIRKYLAGMDVEFAEYIVPTTPSATETETEAQPTVTETEAQPTETEAQPTATATEAQPTGTESQAQPTESQVQPTEPIFEPTEPTTPFVPVTESQTPSQTQSQTQAPTQSQTQAPTQSQTQSQTQPSVTQPAGNTVTLSLNVEEESPRYTKYARTERFEVPKGENTVVLTLPSVYHASSDFTPVTAAERVSLNLNGTPLTAKSVVIAENNDIVYTYVIQVTADATLGGTAAHPNFHPFTIAVNGQGGQTPTGGSQSSTQGSQTTQSTQGGVTPPAAEGDANIDLVTLTYNDAAASEYGVTFHSFSELKNPVVQIVAGTTSDKAAFSAANEVAATSRSASTREWQNYSPTTYEFDYKWEDRAKMTVGVTTYIHKAVLSGLSYGATYSYRVGDKTTGAWSPIYTFTTRPATVGDFSFIFTADTQPELGDKKAYLGMNALFNKAFDKAPNAAFLLSGGDFIYCSDEGQGGISQWRNVINGGNNFNAGAAGSLFAEHPWMVANGNHDNNLVQNFFNNKTTGIDKDYYSFNYGNTHFTILDSGHNGSLDSTQLSWLSSDLAAASSAKFKMVFLHWPFYCHNERDLKDSSRNAIDLFEQYGVDFVVSAHVNEDYYTTYPLKDDAVATKEFTTESGVQYFKGGKGPIYLQNAASGLSSKLDAGGTGKMFTGKNDGGKTCSYPDLMIHPMRAGIESSFMVVDVTGTKLTLNRYYLDKSLNIQRYDVGQVGVVRE